VNRGARATERDGGDERWSEGEAELAEQARRAPHAAGPAPRDGGVMARHALAYAWAARACLGSQQTAARAVPRNAIATSRA